MLSRCWYSVETFRRSLGCSSKMDWPVLLGAIGACTLPPLSVLAGNLELPETSSGETPLAMPASTLRRNLVCRILSDFGTRLAWARTRMRQPSSAVVLWRSSTAALSGSWFFDVFWQEHWRDVKKREAWIHGVEPCKDDHFVKVARSRFNVLPISVMSRRFAWGHVCNHWLHRSGILQVPRIPFTISWA